MNTPLKQRNGLSSQQRSDLPRIMLLVSLYVTLALFDNFKGIFVPYFKLDFQISNSQIGVLLTSSLLAYAVFQYICGLLVERFGHKQVIGGGIIVAIMGLFLITHSHTFLMLVAGLFALNAGAATFNVAVNTLGPMLNVASTVVLMNIINFSYGASNTIAQKITGTLLARGFQWQTFFNFLIVCCLVIFSGLVMIRIPRFHQGHQQAYTKSDLFRNKYLYLFIVAIGFYLAAEYGTGNWFVNYMNESFSLDADRRSIYIALFFGLETAGRLFGGFIVDRLGYYRSILVYGAFALVLTVVGIALGQRGLLLFSLAGLGYSIIYPTIMLAFFKVFKAAATFATGLMLMCGTLIAMLFNLLIGLANDAIGAGPAFYLIAVCLAIFLLAVFVIWRMLKAEKNTSILAASQGH